MRSIRHRDLGRFHELDRDTLMDRQILAELAGIYFENDLRRHH
jgi:hypothetical protein